MKTTYWLVTAAAVAAAGVTIYARLTAGDPPLPKVPAVSEAPRETPRLALPPVVMPPDDPEPLAIPNTPPPPKLLPLPKTGTPAAPLVLPVPVPTMSVVPASGVVPLPPLPAAPTLPSAVKPVEPPPPFEPLVLPPPPKPPVLPANPELPLPPSVSPVKPPAVPAVPVVPPSPPTPVSPPAAPAPVLQPPVPAKPQPLPLPLPTPTSDSGPREPLAVVGKFVVLKDDKLIEGTVSVNNNTVVVRQGGADRPFPKDYVQFVASSRDEVYKFMLAKVPPKDATARLKVARWCMFSGLREQALTEAREVQKIQPNNGAAADMVRSLELSASAVPG